MTLGGDLHYGRYSVENQDEWLMRIGDVNASPVLILPPLFEELNRTRALLAGMMRGLAANGLGCWLPDLPGTGESERALDSCSWQLWQDAVRSAAEQVADRAGRVPAIASVRGGGLLETGLTAPCFWRFAPAEGASLARDLVRASLVSAGEQTGAILDLAGYPVPRPLLDALGAQSPVPSSPLRVVRLESDRADADAKMAGPALWRRSEPGNAPALAEALADDLAAWIETCASC